MIQESLARMGKVGKREDLSYRSATPEEAERCRKAERMKSWSLPAQAFGIFIGLALTIYCFISVDSPYVWPVGAVITLIEVIAFFVYKADAAPSKSFEVIEGEVTSITRTNKRKYVNAWVEQDQVTVRKYRWCSAFHLYTGTRVMLVRGDRGEGKKPDYFAIAIGDDPFTR
ncbi:hypothetical protein SAMN06296952_1153 [Oscillospiraceae bacterium]|nr:hypothetical protein SAMN06296952_1153 [Oscillospiraceae bacterium]